MTEDSTPPHTPPAGPPSSERILLVEDDPDSCELMKQILEGGGYQVVAVSSGLQGLARAGETRFDLVLLDVMLPGVDGFEVCHRLRRDPATGDVPIVMISAKGRQDDIETGLRVGANAYLLKPISRADLLAAVRMQLDDRRPSP